MLTGSIRDLKINNNTYDVVGESDFTVKPSYENTTTPTSGASIISSEKKNPDVENIKINASDPATYEELKAISQEATLVPVSFTGAGGQIFQSEACSINLGDYVVKAGTLELTLLPAGEWLTS
jgi:hypothetical protein